MSERVRNGVLVWVCDRNRSEPPNDGKVREQKYLGSVETMEAIGWTVTADGQHVCPFCSEDPLQYQKLRRVFEGVTLKKMS